VKEDGVLLFHVEQQGLPRAPALVQLARDVGLLVRSCSTLTTSSTRRSSVDSSSSPGENRWNFTFNIIRVKYASAVRRQDRPDAVVGQEPYVELNRLPKGYFLSGVDWFTTITYNSGKLDIIKTWFTVEKAESARPPRPRRRRARRPSPTQPPPQCAKDCSGHGVCVDWQHVPVRRCSSRPTVSRAALRIMEVTTVGSTIALSTVQTQPLSTTTQSVQPIPTEPSRTKDPNLASGTFTGTKVQTQPPITQVKTTAPVASTTAGVAQVVLSVSAVVLGMLMFAL
jgi:hypothetical protein